MNIYIKEGGYHSYLFCTFKDGLIKNVICVKRGLTFVCNLRRIESTSKHKQITTQTRRQIKWKQAKSIT